MSESITISNVDRVPAPDEPEYEAHVDVLFSTGVKVRHAINPDGSYIEQVFDANESDAVVEENFVEEEVSVALEEYVTVWMDVTMDLIESGENRWDIDRIRSDAA